MLLDVAIGVLGSVLFSQWQDTPLSMGLVMLHVAFALLPDADFMFQIIRRRSFAAGDASHRHLLHNPLLYIPLGALVVAAYSFTLAWSFILLSLMHFLHDSVGIGWGVRWLYPFSKRSYKLFSDQSGAISLNPLASWSSPEEVQLETQYNPDKDWFRRVYLRPNPIALTEHVFTLAVVAGIVVLLI